MIKTFIMTKNIELKQLKIIAITSTKQTIWVIELLA